MTNNIDINSIKDFLLKDNTIEFPLYYNNLGKTLRFDLISKSESESNEFINSIFEDVFCQANKMYIIFYGDKYNTSQSLKRYFKPFSTKLLFSESYNSKYDEDKNEDDPYIGVFISTIKRFNRDKYFSDYLNGELKCQMAFLSWKKATVIHYYDSRGVDLFSSDKDFLLNCYEKYKKWIIEYNKKEIQGFLNLT